MNNARNMCRFIYTIHHLAMFYCRFSCFFVSETGWWWCLFMICVEFCTNGSSGLICEIFLQQLCACKAIHFWPVLLLFLSSSHLAFSLLIIFSRFCYITFVIWSRSKYWICYKWYYYHIIETSKLNVHFLIN